MQAKGDVVRIWHGKLIECVTAVENVSGLRHLTSFTDLVFPTCGNISSEPCGFGSSF